VAPRKQFKDTERRIAELLGGTRVPINGRARGSAPDIESSWLSPEVKSYDKNPPSIHNAMAQAKASARDGKLPIAVFHKNGTRYTEALVILTLADFLENFGAG